MNKKLIVLCGISGSGKSTYASQLVRENPQEYALVNRDKIRELLFGYTEETISSYYLREDLGKLEKQVTLYEDTLIHEGLNLGRTVIVDATHLETKYLKRFEFWNVPIEYKYFDISIITALVRDGNRTRKVGVDIINKQFEKYKKLDRLPNFEPVEFIQDETLRPCIIYDIDGTIAQKGDRSAYDWKSVGKDSMVSNVIATMDYIDSLKRKSRPEIIICTGRDGVCFRETSDWLEENNIPWDTIYMRDEGDQRPDWVVKEEMWREIAKENYIVMLYDDRNQVCRRARALGLKVAQVEYGNF